MNRIFFFFLLIPLIARAEWDQLFTQDEDHALYHHVHVISGNLNLSFEDTLIKGAVPFPLMRTYSSAGALERCVTPRHDEKNEESEDKYFKKQRGGFLIQGGWNYLPHANLMVTRAPKKREIKAYLSEKSGNVLCYSYDHVKDNHVVLRVKKDAGQTFSARTNPKLNRLFVDTKTCEATLFLPDGGTRTYKANCELLYDERALVDDDDDEEEDGRPPDQEVRFLRLYSEHLPSGHHIYYEYNKEKRIAHISVTNPSGSKSLSWMHFEYFRIKTPFHFQILTSDNKQIRYRAEKLKDRDYICEVASNCRPQEAAGYSPGRRGIGCRINNLHLGGRHQFKATYYKPSSESRERAIGRDPEKKSFHTDKVETLEAPLGPNGELQPLAKFAYVKNYTDARDVNHVLTRYHHNKTQVTQVDHFEKGDRNYSSLKLLWDGDRLKAKIFLDAYQRPLFSKTFAYDGVGNVVEETLWGNLSGHLSHPFEIAPNGSLHWAESYSKKYTYLPHYNVPLTEEDHEGLTFRYTYLPETNLLSSKLTCDKDKILKREFYFYNEDHLLVCELIDDGNTSNYEQYTGFTRRHYKHYELNPSTGIPEAIVESYFDHASNQEKLLKKTDLTYSSRNEVISETVFDADKTERYTIHTDYDEGGRVTRKTTPLGQENRYRYDAQGNLLEAEEVGIPKKIYTYDAASRPISCTEIDKAGNQRVARTQYDAKGRAVFQTDPKGNSSSHLYDDFGRCLKTEFCSTKDEQGAVYTPEMHFTYDVQGNLISTTTPKGETTRISYNTLQKPVRIVNPDGTEVIHGYTRAGNISKTYYPDKTEAHFTYDLFQRMTAKIIYSSTAELLTTEKWEYNAFHLLSYTDPTGLVTRYTYDTPGRKIAEEIGGRVTTYHYDALGYLERTTQGEITHVQIHDVEGRVIEDWTEEASGRIENKMRFTYNADGKKEQASRQTSQGEAIDLFAYDAEGRLSKHTDPLGAVTQFLYNDHHKNELGQTVLQKTTIDPLGNATIETFDALNHLISCEKKNPQGEIVSKEELFYDRSGNKARRETTVYLENKPLKTISISWEHDSLGRVITENEAGQKITRYTYDAKGRMSTRTLPKGVTLYYSYDPLDRLLELKSSDDTVHYQYLYKLGPNPVQALDLVHHTKIERKYSLFGEITQETNPYGSLHWDYDHYGRCTTVKLPDASSIAYSYTGVHLSHVARNSSTGTPLYEHEYLQFDVNGHVSEEKVIHNLGTISTRHDLLERPTHQQSSWATLGVSYGPSNLVTEIQNSLFGDKKYNYDALNQLIQEGDKEYHFDSLGNSTDFETNDCNQVLSTPDCQFTHDADGNPIERIFSDHTIVYSYDALGRLTEIVHPDKRKVSYIYDPFSRLLSKESYNYAEGTWTKDKTLFYLHDRDKEIGTLDENRTLKQLKVLGLGLMGDIGAAIAIETEQGTFAPLHDFRGNIIALINSEGTLAETYEFDAFGKEKSSISTPLSPWRFCSKRSEEEFIFFGKRFYDPSIGRWFTPDPAGFVDGANLYLYVRNSPTNRLDLFGLFSQAPTGCEHQWLDISVASPEDIYYLYDNTTVGKMHFCCTRVHITNDHADYMVIGGDYRKLQFSPDEIDKGIVSIARHFHKLIPQNKDGAEIFIAENGINTTFKEFVDGMCKPIMEQLPEGALFMGLYNQSRGFFRDAGRMFTELAHFPNRRVISKRQLILECGQAIEKINPSIIITLLDHSEAGLITCRMLEGMNSEEKKVIKNKLITLSFGSVKAIPKGYGLEAINTYSENDHITRWFAGQPYVNNPNYDIRIVRCESPWSEWSARIGDHGIEKTTYSNNQIDQLGYVLDKHGSSNATR